jgi:hypothetical protein
VENFNCHYESFEKQLKCLRCGENFFCSGNLKEKIGKATPERNSNVTMQIETERAPSNFWFLVKTYFSQSRSRQSVKFHRETYF